MRIFVTGATGFIGSSVIKELINAGHHVVGLIRSDAGAEALTHAGAEVFRGDVNDLDRLRTAAVTADGVIHTAFNHDFSNLKQHSEEDRKVIETLGEALLSSNRPLVVASGTGLVARLKPDEPVLEIDEHVSSTEFPRAATEEATDSLAIRGGNVVVVRLSQVHDTCHQGRIAVHIKLALEKGYVAYVGEGNNRLSAVHISDAVRLFRLALEKGRPGAHYHAVGEEGIAMRYIAEVIGTGLKLPVKSLSPEDVPAYFGFLSNLAAIDLAASSAWTRQQLGWNPTGPDFLTDLRNTDYSTIYKAARKEDARCQTPASGIQKSRQG
ncbi:MAG: SDR family oxidoreductase [Synergistaceae bacterium]|jgi:nucleoside-diphosphate-sugar epimerase|nr:SDR family oxidoreductase [Synergistaceae bacterium]